jgi:hypothetical protein
MAARPGTPRRSTAPRMCRLSRCCPRVAPRRCWGSWRRRVRRPTRARARRCHRPRSPGIRPRCRRRWRIGRTVRRTCAPAARRTAARTSSAAALRELRPRRSPRPRARKLRAMRQRRTTACGVAQWRRRGCAQGGTRQTFVVRGVMRRRARGAAPRYARGGCARTQRGTTRHRCARAEGLSVRGALRCALARRGASGAHLHGTPASWSAASPASRASCVTRASGAAPRASAAHARACHHARMPRGWWVPARRAQGGHPRARSQVPRGHARRRHPRRRTVGCGRRRRVARATRHALPQRRGAAVHLARSRRRRGSRHRLADAQRALREAVSAAQQRRRRCMRRRFGYSSRRVRARQPAAAAFACVRYTSETWDVHCLGSQRAPVRRAQRRTKWAVAHVAARAPRRAAPCACALSPAGAARARLVACPLAGAQSARAPPSHAAARAAACAPTARDGVYDDGRGVWCGHRVPPRRASVQHVRARARAAAPAQASLPNNQDEGVRRMRTRSRTEFGTLLGTLTF